MSDTAKSSEEIEDVLSSIRRLVSDHHAPERSVDQPDTPPPPSEGADKLVLTPALRVTDPDDPWAPVPLKSDADDSPEPDDAWQPDDRLAVFDVVGAASEDAPSMPATEAPDAALGEAPEDAHGRRTLGGDDMAAPVPAEHHDQDDAPIDRDVIAAEEAVADILGEQSAAAPDDFEPETGDVDWPGSNAERALRDLAAARGAGQPDMPVDLEPQPPEATDTAAEEDKPEFTPIFSRRRSDELARPKQDMQVSEPEGEPQSETETVADQDTAPVTAPPHAQEPTPEDAKPETALPDHEAEARVAASGPTLQEVPRPERDPSPVEDDTGHDAIEDLGDEASPFTFPEDEAGILDEETLREIVAEVVREELQGPLGQRITRNVRKMVRREIRLMLAADELD